MEVSIATWIIGWMMIFGPAIVAWSEIGNTEDDDFIRWYAKQPLKRHALFSASVLSGFFILMAGAGANFRLVQ